MKRNATSDSPWALFAGLVAALALIAFVSRGDGLDAATKLRPRNPMIEVHLRDLDAGEAITIDVDGLWELRTTDGTFLARDTGMRGWLELRPEGLSVAGWKVENQHVILQTFGDQALALDTYHYRGRLHLRTLRENSKTRLQLSLELPLEDYVLGVLIGEMSTQVTGVDAALQAQAIAARTYVVYQMRRGRSMIRSTVADQRFLSTDFETETARQAVQQTTGLVLKHEDRLVPAYFHADCGGSTSNATLHEFGDSPVLRAVPDIGAAGHLSLTDSWERIVPAEKLDAIAQAWGLGDHARSLDIMQRDDAGRVVRAQFTGVDGSRAVPGDRIRAELGLPSALITLLGVLRDGSLRVEGIGNGHGIGLCQLGALAQARAGRDARAILAHYYPGARIAILSDPVQP